MSESQLYLGVTVADCPVISYEQSIVELIQDMRHNGTDTVSGVHRAPCLVRNTASTGDVFHPVLGAGSEKYAGFPYSTRHLLMNAQRVKRSRVGGQGYAKGDADELRIRLSMDTEPDRIGTVVHKPFGTSAEDQVKVAKALESSFGYIALQVNLSALQDHGAREVALLGQAEDGGLHELPFTNHAAAVLLGQLASALHSDL